MREKIVEKRNAFALIVIFFKERPKGVEKTVLPAKKTVKCAAPVGLVWIMK